LREEDVGIDHLVGVVAVAESFVNIDNFTLKLLGFGITPCS
jgi:hypothetical protein